MQAAFQNIKCWPHFGVRGRGFFNTFVPLGTINGIGWSSSQTACQIFHSVSVVATGMSSSMDIYSSFSLPSGGSMTIGSFPSNVSQKLP
ncbi:hypothetical protein AVEN_264819-1 [Araneus ventricosus]|uniref:Uncharacterized protein n=1 Tax=Araneus ventricosus TaxID=182803 RepID=A0A4Y2DWW1_ARAVE|nr:hypothetical protein AVEN_264819-1 [Araneus ventricosus]